MQLKLLPIGKTLEDNSAFAANPVCNDTLTRTIEYIKSLGYEPPWIGYYAELEGEIVGTGAFKGPPKDNKVEIAYVVWKKHRSRGIGSAICRALVSIWNEHHSSVILTAQTLPSYNYSNQILKKNRFIHKSEFEHPEDGTVWEWEYETLV